MQFIFSSSTGGVKSVGYSCKDVGGTFFLFCNIYLLPKYSSGSCIFVGKAYKDLDF